MWTHKWPVQPTRDEETIIALGVLHDLEAGGSQRPMSSPKAKRRKERAKAKGRKADRCTIERPTVGRFVGSGTIPGNAVSFNAEGSMWVRSVSGIILHTHAMGRIRARTRLGRQPKGPKLLEEQSPAGRPHLRQQKSGAYVFAECSTYSVERSERH